MMLKFIKYVCLTIFGVVIVFFSLFMILAMVFGTIAVKENGWTIGSENYVSDDFETLYIDGIEYQRFEVPFEICGTRWQSTKYYTNFAEWKNMHGSIYIESVSKRYPLVWWSDIDYVLGEYALSENITIMQLTNEYTNESYNYCLPEHISVVAEIVNNVTWEQNLTFAVQLDEYEDATIGARTEKMSPEFSAYILESREKLSSVASSYMDVKMNIVNSNTDIAIYQYDDNMNFRKRLFVIRKTDDGSFVLYDEICMFLNSSTPNSTLEDYGYLVVPENLEQEINALLNN